MRFLLAYIRKYRHPFSMAVACLTVEAFCDLMQPTIMSKIIDIGVAGKEIDYVLKAGVLMLGVAAVGALAAVGRNILASNVSQHFGRDLRRDLYRQIQGFSFANINRFETASLVTRLTNDVNQVQNFFNGTMRIFVKAPLVCIGSIGMAILLNLEMSRVLLVIIPIISGLIVLSMTMGYPYFAKVQACLDRVNGVIREYLAGVRVVKAFNRFDYEEKRFEKANRDLVALSTIAMRVMAGFLPGIILTVNLGVVAVLWYGGIRVNAGAIQVGQIIAFINYMTQILFSLMMMSFVFTMFVRAKASGERIAEVFTENNPPDQPIPTPKIPTEPGKIEFQQVHFSYSGSLEEPVLKAISFYANSGETVGIIGSTGSGKSTLVNLIPRFYDPDCGSVKVSGIDVRDWDVQALREIIAVVPQKSRLFTGTILDNLRWGKEDATLEESQQVAAIAQAHEFISRFPEGYGTQIGQGGVNLSGGQKQRISIARALLKRPQILILDDSTSAVDVITEAQIRTALKEYARKTTCLLIAQRITSVMGADQIIVLEDGVMVGWGKHDQLVETCQIYREIFRSQIGKEVS